MSEDVEIVGVPVRVELAPSAVVAEDFKLAAAWWRCSLEMVLNAKDDGEISELGLKRIRYCEAAPNTSNMVDSGEETRADERPPPLPPPPPPPPVLAPAAGELVGCTVALICALETDTGEVDEPEATRLDDGGATGCALLPVPPVSSRSPFEEYWSSRDDKLLTPTGVGNF